MYSSNPYSTYPYTGYSNGKNLFLQIEENQDT